MTSGLCRVGFSSSLTSCEAYGSIFSIEGPSAPLLDPSFGVTSLLLPVGRGVTVFDCIGAVVVPPPVANPVTGAGATIAGITAATCEFRRYAADGIVRGMFPRDLNLRSLPLFWMLWVNLFVTCSASSVSIGSVEVSLEDPGFDSTLGYTL